MCRRTAQERQIQRLLVYSGLLLLPVIESTQAQTNLQFQQLPREIREHAAEVRKSCKAADFELRNDMQEIENVSLR